MHDMATRILCGLRDTASVRLVRTIGRSIGARVIVATDGESVARQLADERLTLAFLELKYDETDIFELLALARRRPDAPEIILVTTEDSNRPDRPDYADMAAMQGASGTIDAPLSREKLLGALQRYRLARV
jgi:CheY-like chemotaxis protein